jgi:hypothetical protein
VARAAIGPVVTPIGRTGWKPAGIASGIPALCPLADCAAGSLSVAWACDVGLNRYPRRWHAIPTIPNFAENGNAGGCFGLGCQPGDNLTGVYGTHSGDFETPVKPTAMTGPVAAQFRRAPQTLAWIGNPGFQ